MLKCLAVFGVLLVVLCPNCGAEQIQRKQGDEKPPAPVTAIPQQQRNTTDPQGGKSEEDIHADVKIVNPPQKDFYDKAPVWISIALFGAAFFTLLAIKRQANLMETQVRDARDASAEASSIALSTARAAQENAAAAVAQLEMVKSKERAQLRIEFDELNLVYDQKLGGYPVRFSVVVDGTTRATIIEDYLVAYLAESPKTTGISWEPLGLPRVMSPNTDPIQGFTLVQTGDDVSVYETDPERIRLVRDKKLDAYVAGRIRYKDVFGDRWMLHIERVWRQWSMIATPGVINGVWAPAGNGKGDFHVKEEKHSR